MSGAWGDPWDTWALEALLHKREVVARYFGENPCRPAYAQVQDLPPADLDELHDSIEHECPWGTEGRTR